MAARPVPILQANRCADDRYPALAGEWAVGCVRDDRVNVAISLRDGRAVTLNDAVLSPALGDGWLWAPGRPSGGWGLPGSSRGALGGVEPVMVPFEGVAPASVARFGEVWRAAVPYAEHVDFIDLHSNVWPRFDARPLPGEPVAVGDGWVAWVEGGAASGRDIWIVRVVEGTPISVGGTELFAGRPAILAGGPGEQHGAVARGGWLWWVDGDEVVGRLLTDSAEVRVPAFTGFEAGIAVSDEGTTACWEDRRALGTPVGIDVWCSDGSHVDRPGDQRWPSMGGGWLMWREGEQVLAGRSPRSPTASSPSPGSP